MRSDLILQNIHIAKFTTMEVGGTVEFYSRPQNIKELKYIVKWAYDSGIDVFVIGGGSDIIFGDGHHRLIVVDMRSFKGISLNERAVRAMSGAVLNRVIQIAAKEKLSGLEELYGIPGTVGGAVRKNAGAFGKEIKDVLISAKILNVDGEILEYEVKDLGLKYRESDFDGILVEAVFLLQKADSHSIMGKMKEIIEKRRNSQPRGKTSGCIFKNPENGPPAGFLLDKSGLKGFRIGQAKFSEIHANFIVNMGGAKAEDVFNLIEVGKKRVFENFGIKLEEEVVILR